jgi:hypothetical protein
MHKIWHLLEAILLRMLLACLAVSLKDAFSATMTCFAKSVLLTCSQFCLELTAPVCPVPMGVSSATTNSSVWIAKKGIYSSMSPTAVCSRVDGRYGQFFQPAHWDLPWYVAFSDNSVVLVEKARRQFLKRRK